MLAARMSPRAIFLVLALCLIGSTSAYPQSAVALNAPRMPSSRMSSEAWLAKCSPFLLNLPAARRFTNGFETPPAINEIAGDSNITRPLEGVCPDAALPVPTPAPVDNPCLQNISGMRALPSTLLCNEAEDTVPAELSALGKPGLKIARAREKVLDILRSENVCTEWFETKDNTPADTFRSLNFLLDLHGPQDIVESIREESIVVRRQPYVAQATQDAGAHTTITINANGAFYRPQGNVLKIVPEGGPVHSVGTRLLTVGSYRGDTLPAQTVTLLHELGHIIDLLPEDADNLDGKSVRNTDEVLRHCRAEVEARSQQARQTAKR
jgi:hypothetical protein